jgi:hypothetical protein
MHDSSRIVDLPPDSVADPRLLVPTGNALSDVVLPLPRALLAERIPSNSIPQRLAEPARGPDQFTA